MVITSISFAVHDFDSNGFELISSVTQDKMLSDQMDWQTNGCVNRWQILNVCTKVIHTATSASVSDVTFTYAPIAVVAAFMWP